MVEEENSTPTPEITVKPSTKRWIITLVLSVALMQLLGVGGAYFVGFHEGAVAANKAIHAAEVASRGRSKALCGALKQLAETPAAVKLHPIFENVYSDTGCVKITGKARR